MDAGFNHRRQCADFVLRMVVIAPPPKCGPGIPQRIFSNSRSSSFVRPPGAMPSGKNLWQKIRSPISELGTGPKAWALTNLPGAMPLVPAPLRTRFVKTHLPPDGAWWLRARVEHQIPVHCGTKLTSARRVGGRAVLRLRNTQDRTEFDLAADRVIVGTGYDVDVDRLSFLDLGILSIGCPTYQCDRFNTVSSGRSNRARGEHRLFVCLSRATRIQA